MALMNPRTSRRSRWLWIFIPIIAIIGISLLVLSRNGSNTPSANPQSALRNQVLEVTKGLDILQVEYPKVLKGEPSGAVGSFSRARDAFNGARSDLEKIDSEVAIQIAADFDSLQKLIDSKAPADQVVPLAGKMQSALLDAIKNIPK